MQQIKNFIKKLYKHNKNINNNINNELYHYSFLFHYKISLLFIIICISQIFFLKINNPNIFILQINFIRSIIIIPFSILFIIRNVFIIYLIIKNFNNWYIRSNPVWGLTGIRLGITRIITATSSIFFGVGTRIITSDIIVERATGTGFLEKLGKKYGWREDYKDVAVFSTEHETSKVNARIQVSNVNIGASPSKEKLIIKNTKK